MVIFYGVKDNGDGSSSVSWCRTTEMVEKLNSREEYYSNEGIFNSLTLPDDLDLHTLGVSFYEDRANCDFPDEDFLDEEFFD